MLKVELSASCQGEVLKDVVAWSQFAFVKPMEKFFEFGRECDSAREGDTATVIPIWH